MLPVAATIEAGVAKMPVPITRLAMSMTALRVPIRRFAFGTLSKDSPSPLTSAVTAAVSHRGPIQAQWRRLTLDGVRLRNVVGVLRGEILA